MKHGLLVMVFSMSLYAPLVCTTQKNFIQDLLKQYAPTLPVQGTKSQEVDDVPKKTKSRYRRWFKQAEGIVLVIILDLVVYRAFKEHYLPEMHNLDKKNQELQDEIEQIREDMVGEITKIADVKIQGDTQLGASYMALIETVNNRMAKLEKKQANTDQVYLETADLLDTQINRLDKQVDRLGTIEKHNGKLAVEFPIRQQEMNKNLLACIDGLSADVEKLKNQTGSNESKKNDQEAK